MSYAAYRVVHAPTGVHCCAAAHLTTDRNSSSVGLAYPAAFGGYNTSSNAATGSTDAALPNLVVCKGNVLQVFAAEEVSRKQCGSEVAGGGASAHALELVCEHRLNGTVHSMAVASGVPGSSLHTRDALVLTFREAKVSVLEFDPSANCLRPSSLHYLESGEWMAKKKGAECFPRGPLARSDPLGRCSAVVVYNCHLHVLLPKQESRGTPQGAILSPKPSSHDRHHQAQAVATKSNSKAIKYGGSFTVDFRSHGIHEVVDLAFIADNAEPTAAVLWRERSTWAGRMGGKIGAAQAFVCCVTVIAINLATKESRTLYSVKHMPFNAYRLSALPAAAGAGVLVLADNSLHCISCADQTLTRPIIPTAAPRPNASFLMSSSSSSPSARVPPLNPLSEPSCCHLAVNAKGATVPAGTPPYPQATTPLELEAAHATWIAPTTVVLGTKGGTLAIVTLSMANRLVKGLEVQLARPVPQSSCIAALGPELLFLGSRLGDSLLIKCSSPSPQPSLSPSSQPGLLGAPTSGKHSGTPVSAPLAVVAGSKRGREAEDAATASAAAGAAAAGAGTAERGYSLSVCDSLTNIGPLRDVAVFKIPATSAATAAGAAGEGGEEDHQAQQRQQQQQKHQQRQVLLGCSGHGKNGALSVLTQHVLPDVLTEEELPGCQGLWTVYGPPSLSPSGRGEGRSDGDGGGDVKMEDGEGSADKSKLAVVDKPSNSAAFHSYLILSLSAMTMVLETGELLREVSNEVEFHTQGPTICAANIFQRQRVVQVWAEGVRLIHGAKKTQDIGIADIRHTVSASALASAAVEAEEEERGQEGAVDTGSTAATAAAAAAAAAAASAACIVAASVGDPYVALMLSDNSLCFAMPDDKDPHQLSTVHHPHSRTINSSPMVAASMVTGNTAANWLASTAAEAPPQEEGKGLAAPGPKLTAFCALAWQDGQLGIFQLPRFVPVFSCSALCRGRRLLFDEAGSMAGQGQEKGVGANGGGVEPGAHASEEGGSHANAAAAAAVDAGDGCRSSGGGSGEDADKDIVEEKAEVHELLVAGGFGPCAAGAPLLLAYLSDGRMLCYRAFSKVGARGSSRSGEGGVPDDSVISRRGMAILTQKQPQKQQQQQPKRQRRGSAEEAGADEYGFSGAQMNETANSSRLVHLGFQRQPLDWFASGSGGGGSQSQASMSADGAGKGEGGASGARLRFFRFDGIGGEDAAGGDVVSTLSGVFVSGPSPSFLTLSRQRPRMHPMGANGGVVAFAPFHNVNCNHGFLFVTTTGELKICQLPCSFVYDSCWPVLKVPLRATPHFLAVPPDSSVALVATSTMASRSAAHLFPPDDANADGAAVGSSGSSETAAAAATTVVTEQFELRVMAPAEPTLSTWRALQTVSLQAFEHVTCMKILSLKNSSTGGTTAPLVVVGTALAGTEDIPCRGRVLLFELQRPTAVAAAAQGSEASVKTPPPVLLAELHSHEPSGGNNQKGPVTGIALLQGNLLLAVGRQVVLYSWNGTSLDHVAFLDSPIYVVSLTTIKNFVLLGDVQKSVHFLHWKEAGAQLSQLARDFSELHTVASDFLIDGPNLGLVASDDASNIKVLSYVKSIETLMGQKLQPRAAFHIGSTISKFLRLPLSSQGAKEAKATAGGGRAARPTRFALVAAGLDGSVGVLTPIPELTLRRLDALQGRLITAVPHAAGLNPQSYREFKHRYKEPPTTNAERVVDFELLQEYDLLDVAEQERVATDIGTSRAMILQNISDITNSTSFF